MRLHLFIVFLAALPLWADAEVSFRNEREGESFYSGRSHKAAMEKAARDFGGNRILSIFRDLLDKTSESRLCAFVLNSQLEERLKGLNPRSREFEGAIYYLRLVDEVDDVSAKILLNAHKVVTTNLDLPKIERDLQLPRSKDNVDKIVSLLGSFKTRFAANSCFDDAYRSLLSEIYKFDKNTSTSDLEALLVEGVRRRVLPVDTYKELERARVSELETQAMGLKSYHQKLRSLRTQYPLRDVRERSTFVTTKAEKLKMSRRQKLLENYSDLQIIIMGNIVKKLRERLESPRIEIHVWGEEDVVETIPLEPMERFRFAVRILRKEMSHLALNTYFSGRTPEYLDLMTASYEIGIIPAEELDEIAGLQEMWNPKKTFWDKAGVWIRSFSSIATVAIPPPYGFIPALAIVVIEATVGKKENNTDDPSRIF
jgi:hypothetical protein